MNNPSLAPIVGPSSRTSSGSIVPPSPEESTDSHEQRGFGMPTPPTTAVTTTTTHTQVHPNLFVRGIPLHWTEEQLVELFAKFGELSSLRLVKHSVRKTSMGYGFVRYQHACDASTAIMGLNGKMVDGQILQVKLADSDAGPPSSSSASGLQPCETLYVKHVPLTFSRQDLEMMFGQYGDVIDVKEFPCLDQFRGSSALVKMDSVSSARLAIQHLHGLKPRGWLHNIIVRFAESEAEKKVRLAKKESMTKFKADLSPLSSGEMGSLTPLSMSTAGNLSELHPGVGNPPKNMPVLHTMAQDDLWQPPPTFQQQGKLAVVQVTKLPPTADRLWIYEHFACFGGIQSVELDQWSGVARVYFSELVGGMRAVLEMNHQHGIGVTLCPI